MNTFDLPVPRGYPTQREAVYCRDVITNLLKYIGVNSMRALYYLVSVRTRIVLGTKARGGDCSSNLVHARAAAGANETAEYRSR
jgi:hypothetical protein